MDRAAKQIQGAVVMSKLTWEEFVKRFREIHPIENVSDEVLAAIFTSHIVLREWDNEQQEKARRRMKEKLKKATE